MTPPADQIVSALSTVRTAIESFITPTTIIIGTVLLVFWARWYTDREWNKPTPFGTPCPGHSDIADKIRCSECMLREEMGQNNFKEEFVHNFNEHLLKWDK